MMTDRNRFETVCHRLINSLYSSAAYFRKGEDNVGLDLFENSLAELEKLQEFSSYQDGTAGYTEEAVPVLLAILECMRNLDICGMTDLLEYSFYPLAAGWAGGRGEACGADCGVKPGEPDAGRAIE